MLSHIFRSQCYKRQAAAANLAGRSAQVAEGRRGDQQRFQAAGVGRNVRKKIYIYINIWLVVWNIFSIYWEYSSQLTNIFQRG